ncbi:MAG: LuxR C-terminal-related transcriptional regulator [Bacteroidales bacterium]|nr:LuxR C-terminal-related transcriptional regulator [Bacteroidales bacterium]
MDEIDHLQKELTLLKKENHELRNELDFLRKIVHESDVFLHIDEIYEDNYFKMLWYNNQIKLKLSHILEARKNGVKQYQEERYSKEDMAAIKSVIKEIKEGKTTTYSAAYKVTTKEAGPKWFYTNMVPYKLDENGIPFQFLCASVDLTEKMYDIERYAAMQREVLREQNKEQISKLSGTELQVISLLVTSKSEKEIAETLSRSQHTIKTHLKNIRKKLNLNKNTELVKFAVETGIV